MDDATIPDIAQLVPHRASMSLLDAITAHGPDWVESRAVVRADSPFMESGAVGAWLGIEYMAQTIAAFAGLRAHAAGEPAHIGLLVGTRRFTAHESGIAAGTILQVRAERRFEADNGLASFQCSIRTGERTLAEAMLTVFQPADPAALLVAQLA